MKRVVVILVLLLLAPLVSQAAPVPPPSHPPSRHRHISTARTIGLIASLFTMPWSVMMVARGKGGAKTHARRAKPDPVKARSPRPVNTGTKLPNPPAAAPAPATPVPQKG